MIGLALAFIQPGVAPGVFAADKENGSINGTVVVESGGGTKPVPNAEVRLTFGSKSDARKTGADGKFAFSDLLPGKYTLRLRVVSALVRRWSPGSGGCRFRSSLRPVFCSSSRIGVFYDASSAPPTL